jgi:hypothetical protein
MFLRPVHGQWPICLIVHYTCLGSLRNLIKVSKFNVQQIEYGPDLTNLHADKRWQKIVDNIRKQAEKNGYPQEEIVLWKKRWNGIAHGMGKTKSKIKR